jgi:glucose/mannose-6-phosphate isomerase
LTLPRVDLSLDDSVSIQRVDASGMLGLVGTLGEQLQHGFDLGRSADGLPRAEGLRNVVVCGMGGSGITGDVLRSVLATESPIPIVPSKGYALPGFGGPETAVLAVSYSGNTEETVAAYQDAVARGCSVTVIASGGDLLARAQRDGAPAVAIPSDVLAPRAALGYLVGAGVGVLDAVGLTPADGRQPGAIEWVARCGRNLKDLAARLGPDRPVGSNQAKELAAWLRGATPLVWATEGVAEAAALRWKTQLNENAKVPAFSAVLPEIDHNEVEGWSREGTDAYRILVLRSGVEPERIPFRVRATLEAMGSVGLQSREVWAEGSSPLEQALSLVLIGDHVSVYLAVLYGVDPTPIPVLTALKDRRTGFGGAP